MCQAIWTSVGGKVLDTVVGVQCCGCGELIKIGEGHTNCSARLEEDTDDPQRE